MVKTSDITMHRHPHIGACRAAWEPGKDLAMLHLMPNCVESVFCHNIVRYTYICSCACV